ncbi:WD40 repeat-like protein [Rhizoctonia solani]|uniref:WD40 repeat-like protein n=1 Tax=Rhizoctonia solani TaxID=456999 RepID=A0A8H7H9K0_9AGAM|nr:WD40 repeat-like protein [Rhizoctonia solani]
MRSPPPQPQLVLAPARHTTVVTTTTTTTTTYQPISLPALPPAPSSPKDPKLYPLLNAPVPSHLRQFPLTFPNGARAIFKDPSFEPDVEAKRSIRQGTYDEERVGGQGWELLRPADRVPLAKGKGKAREDVIHLAEAVDRYQLGRQKRVYEGDNDMEGVEMAHQTVSQAPSMPDLSVMGLINSPPPRKKARASTIPIPPTTQSLVAPPSPLPSPSGSPSSTPIQLAPPTPTPPIQPDLTLTTLLALPQLISHFSGLPPNLQSHVLLQLLRQSTLPVLRNVHSVLTPALARDFLTLLPPELTAQILSHLPPSALFAAARVSRAWRQLIDQDMTLWRALLKATRTWFGGPSELAYMTRTLAIRDRNPDLFSGRPQPHPFKLLYRRREQTRRNWLYNQPRRLTFAAHGSSVVTCLLFSRNRIISASDDHQIHVYSPTTGELLLRLEGHEGGVWALAVSPNSPSAPHATDCLVSGSTDRTVRIWDLSNGKCTHVFGGHTSTVRCLAIVKPMWIDVNGRKEKWPKRTLIVTGSRDHTLRVWKLPRRGDPEYRCVSADGEDVDPAEDDANRNPYHVRLLSGHTHAVRALAAHGRTLISGSYDTTVRVWDIITGECKWTLDGHSQKVYSVVLDPQRNQAMSGSMDGTVRIWSLATGQALHTLTGHSSLVGLLGLSPTHLVSAAADSTLRIWDPTSGVLQHTLSAHTGAITCFQHDEFKVLSGSDGTLKMWDVREGSVVRDLLTGITGVWQVVFEGRWCVAASNRQEQTYLDVWDFGGEDPDNEIEAEEGDWMEASEDESEPEDGDDDIDVVDEGGDLELGDEDDEEEDMDEDMDPAQDPTHYRQSGSSLQHRAPGYGSQRRFATLGTGGLAPPSSLNCTATSYAGPNTHTTPHQPWVARIGVDIIPAVLSDFYRHKLCKLAILWISSLCALFTVATFLCPNAGCEDAIPLWIVNDVVVLTPAPWVRVGHDWPGGWIPGRALKVTAIIPSPTALSTSELLALRIINRGRNMLMIDQMPEHNQTYLPTNSNINTWWPTTQNEEHSYHYQNQLHFGIQSQAQPPYVQTPQSWTNTGYGYRYDAVGASEETHLREHEPNATLYEEPDPVLTDSPLTDPGYPGEESEPEAEAEIEEAEQSTVTGKRTRQSGEVGPNRPVKRRKSADGEREPARRSSRACLGCRRFKVRCMPGPSQRPPTESSPCARCAQNGHDCHFKESLRGKYPTKKFGQLKRLHAHLEETLRVLTEIADQRAQVQSRSQCRSRSEPSSMAGPSSYTFY